MNAVEQIQHAAFGAGEHLSGVLRLCEEEGWESFPARPERTATALRAPGVTTVVAVSGGEVVGFAQAQGEGVLQTHLSLLAMERRFRGRGIGRRLVEDSFRRSGAGRIDLISPPGVEGFYESFPHKARPGFRIYPHVGGETA